MTHSEDIALNPSELGKFYTKYFRYYTTLDTRYQKLFTERALQFIADKVISGAEGFNPDNRVKALVAASAVQLTLGLETWKLNYFEEIELHPSDFDNAAGKLKYSGETNLQGYIKLSWKNFIRGYQVPDDNLNLGLHEFAHALRFNGIRGNEQDYFIDHYFNKWLACAYEAFYDTQNGSGTIFRKYGGANINEFLSVCIEHYFESPGEMKEKYPLLFYATGILLNQDVSNVSTKIGIREEFLSAQNNYLQGLEQKQLQSHFLTHWTFKLWIFVFALFIYSLNSAGFLNPITLAVLFMFICIYVWYDYNAVKIEFSGKQISIEKGGTLFRKRKVWTLPLSQLISLRADDAEWTFTYYNHTDAFFYEEKTSPPKGANDAFLTALKQNKITVFR